MDFLKDFGVQPVLLAAQIVNFAILLFILKKFLYKPILGVLEERRRKIETSMKQSEEIQKKFDETNLQQEKIMDKAKMEAEKIIKLAKQEAKELSEQLQQETKDQIDQTIKRSQESLGLEKQKMIADARREVSKLVFLVTEKILEKELKESEKEKIAEMSIKEIGK